MNDTVTRWVLVTAAMAGIAGLGQAGWADAQTPPPATQPVVPPGPTAAADSTVPVREVVLFSSGVGYFEHLGNVHGDGSTELRFKTEQINDILKSLVLQDLDGGKVSAVTYPSQDPIAKTLKSFQVDITANPPLADMLNQLRGAKVTVEIDGGKITGVILGVEKRRVVVKGEKSDDQTAWEPVLNLVSNGQIVAQPMNPIHSITLDDPALQDELNKALIALAGARDQDKKPVRINFTGKGDHRVRLGYVVETPIWKTSYRLILSDAVQEDKAKNITPSTQPTKADGNLQGWAIIENQTDNDWNNVQLSLISGRPISFIEDLYQPLYIPRPTVEPELFASLRPQVYAGGMQSMQREMQAQQMQRFSALRKSSRDLDSDHLNTLSMPAGAVAPTAAPAAVADEPMDAAKSVQSVASASSVGELFEYTVGNVSLPRQRSAMIPIITDPIEVERVSIYNQSVLARNPLNGARVKNTTKKHLLAGPITVLDGATYAGDAQIDNLPPGQERLLSYGVDLQMLVDAADGEGRNDIQTGKIVKGVLHLTRKLVMTKKYEAENKSDHVKTLIIEHPRAGGWELADSPAPMEKTDAVYRFRLTVQPGKTEPLVVTQQIVQDQEWALLPGDVGSIEFFRRQGAIPKPVQDALGKAITLKQALVDTQRQIDENHNRLNDISTEQTRIREDVKIAGQQGPYLNRLMTKLNEQETEIEQIQKNVADLTKTAQDQQKELEDYLGNLNVE